MRKTGWKIILSPPFTSIKLGKKALSSAARKNANIHLRVLLSVQGGSNEIGITARLEGKDSCTWVALKLNRSSYTERQKSRTVFHNIEAQCGNSIETKTLEANDRKSDPLRKATINFRDVIAAEKFYLDMSN